MIPLLGTYSAMTVQTNETISSSGTSLTPPQSYNLTESYSTVYVSSTTYKVNVSSTAAGQNIVYTAWVLKNGTALAIDIEGYNLTGSVAQEGLAGVFAGFAAQVEAGTEISLYTTSSNFHPTGTSTVSIGPTPVVVTSYAANTLPETIADCGTSTTLTAYSLSVGTPQGTNSSLIIYEHLAGSETADGQTTALDVVLQVTSITLASTSTSSTSSTTSTSSSSSSPWLDGSVYPLKVMGNLRRRGAVLRERHGDHLLHRRDWLRRHLREQRLFRRGVIVWDGRLDS